MIQVITVLAIIIVAEAVVIFFLSRSSKKAVRIAEQMMADYKTLSGKVEVLNAIVKRLTNIDVETASANNHSDSLSGSELADFLSNDRECKD